MQESRRSGEAEGGAAPRKQTLAIIVFTLFAAVVFFAAARILAPFATPILLAAIVVTFTYRWYHRLVEAMRGHRNFAALVMLIAVTLVLVLPAFGLVVLLVQQATSLFRLLQETNVESVMSFLRLNERLDIVRDYFPTLDLAAVDFEQMIVGIVREIPGFVATQGGALLASFAQLGLGFLFMLLAAYFFYVDGERLVQELKFLSPLPDRFDEEIFRKFRGVIDATFRGQLLTALAQGVVTSVGLAIGGVPGAIFWGAVAAVFALVPMVGAAIVWIPATLYLFARAALGHIGYGYPIFLLIWGFAIVSLVDNVIRPWAMRSGTRMPAVILFFSILGGVSAFGLVGLILGPLVFALLVTIADIYRSFFSRSLVNQPVPKTEPPPG